MPIRVFQRIWCKKCNNFELHTRKKEDLFCLVCGTQYTDVYLSEIPNEKIMEQRKRYSESKARQFNEFMLDFMHPERSTIKMMKEMMSEPGANDQIMESDAGQKSIDEEKRIRREKEWEERRIQREKDKELAKQYSHLNRNEPCLCGSGKKYKNCCWAKIQSIR